MALHVAQLPKHVLNVDDSTGRYRPTAVGCYSPPVLQIRHYFYRS
ncbi:MAG: hypothetical protein KatS3mg054_1307 [Chloroflexus sp.]|nr:MAG: hypothetical protein KatS3mg054_1307 [Chloroflexus sp.]